MQIHRSAHARSFTVLPNGLLQDRRLSYTARGLLADLLTETELAHALLPGLPSPMHSPAAILRDRLQRKMPPERSAPPPASYAECSLCHGPVPQPGICRPCAGLGTRTLSIGGGAAAARGGAARARAALRGHGTLTVALDC
jgi:hypothetical protein